MGRPGRLATYDSNSAVPTGTHEGPLSGVAPRGRPELVWSRPFHGGKERRWLRGFVGRVGRAGACPTLMYPSRTHGVLSVLKTHKGTRGSQQIAQNRFPQFAGPRSRRDRSGGEERNGRAIRGLRDGERRLRNRVRRLPRRRRRLRPTRYVHASDRSGRRYWSRAWPKYISSQIASSWWVSTSSPPRYREISRSPTNRR